MPPSTDACSIDLRVFFGRQPRFRCAKCRHRVHQRCLMLAAEELLLLTSGESPFICSHCDGSLPASPNEWDIRASEEYDCGEQLAGDNDDGDNQKEGRSSSPISSCTARTAAQHGDLEQSQKLLHGLLLDALEGISFLTNQVACLTEENRRLRTEWPRSTEQQTLLVCSLRDEVKA
ncbi:unnamed protein product, partial [Ixodes persulcatus]